jgi:hypothetical protein
MDKVGQTRGCRERGAMRRGLTDTTISVLRRLESRDAAPQLLVVIEERFQR